MRNTKDYVRLWSLLNNKEWNIYMNYMGEMECYRCDNPHVRGFYDAINDWTIYECDECGWTYIDESGYE